MFDAVTIIANVNKVAAVIRYLLLYSSLRCISVPAGIQEIKSLPAFWNISDLGAKCEKCEMINTITLEEYLRNR
jgi:hypothetical protein